MKLLTQPSPGSMNGPGSLQIIKQRLSAVPGVNRRLDSPTISFDNTIFQEMAAQGQAVFVAAGDNGAYDAGGSTLGVDEPASQPYATAVGISKLTTNSSGAYSSETASVYGGGGISAYWSIPAYQLTFAKAAVKAAMVSTTMRNLPDVVLTADASTAYAFYINGAWWGYYGSSLSSPIWASFISRVNQGLGSNGPIGSVNSALYALAQTSIIQTISMISQLAITAIIRRNRDLMTSTGLGSFNGLNLYNDLVKNSVAKTPPSATIRFKRFRRQRTGLFVLVFRVSGATTYDVKRSTVNGGPYTIIASSVLNTTYTDNPVANGTSYYYVVSAVNSAGQSVNSSQVSATPAAPKTVAAVTNLTGSISGKSILLRWTQSSSPNIASNNVYYSIRGGSFVKLGSVSATTAVSVTGVTRGVTYGFYVTAVNASGLESPASNKVSVVMS